jgi:hypothetical protein
MKTEVSIQDVIKWARGAIATGSVFDLASSILELTNHHFSEKEVLERFQRAEATPFEEAETKELRDKFAIAAFKSTILAYLLQDDRQGVEGYPLSLEDLPLKQLSEQCYKAADEAIEKR